MPDPGVEVHGPPRLRHPGAADRGLAGAGGCAVQARRLVRALGAHAPVGGAGQAAGEPARTRPAAGGGTGRGSHAALTAPAGAAPAAPSHPSPPHPPLPASHGHILLLPPPPPPPPPTPHPPPPPHP